MKTLREQLWFFWLLVLCGCCFVETANQKKNDANQPPRATNAKTGTGGKNKAENNMAMQQPKTQQGIINLGCVGTRIRRYVSNGFCTSRKAIRDTICEGQCVPMDELPWFPQFSKIISRNKREWRCVPDHIRRRKVKFNCLDGLKRRYSVRVVRSCKCKRYTRKQNMSNPLGEKSRG